MKAARLTPTACDRLWTVCGMDGREGGVIYVKSRFGMRQTAINARIITSRAWYMRYSDKSVMSCNLAA